MLRDLRKLASAPPPEQAHACFARGALVGAFGRDLLAWTRLDAAPQRIWSSPGGPIATLAAHTAAREVAVATRDGALWLVAEDGARARRVEKVLAETPPIFSPDGLRVAAALGADGSLVVDVASGRATPIPGAPPDADPFAWDARGLLLCEHDRMGKFRAWYFLWAGDTRPPESTPVPWWTARDGRTRVIGEKSGFVAERDGARRPFVIPPGVLSLAFLSERAPWVGSEHWLLEHTPLSLLDLVTGESHVIDDAFATLEAASDDGRTCVLRRDDALWVCTIDPVRGARPETPSATVPPELGRFLASVRAEAAFDSEFGSREPHERAVREARAALLALGRAAVEPLRARVVTPSGATQPACIEALGALGALAIDAYDELAALARAHDGPAAAACARIDPARCVHDRLHAYAPAVVSRGVVLRALAATEAGRAGVLVALRDVDPWVRRDACDALAGIAEIDRFDVLRGALRDPSPEVRDAAMNALAPLADPRVDDALLDAQCATRAGLPRVIARTARHARVATLVDAIARRDVARTIDDAPEIVALAALLRVPDTASGHGTHDALVAQLTTLLGRVGLAPAHRAAVLAGSRALGDARLLPALLSQSPLEFGLSEWHAFVGLGLDLVRRGVALTPPMLRAWLGLSTRGCVPCEDALARGTVVAVTLAAPGSGECRCGMALAVREGRATVRPPRGV